MNRVELQNMAQAETERQNAFRCRLLCCASTPCLSSGSTAVSEAMKQALTDGNLDAEVEVVATGCMGPCSRGPLVTVKMPGQEDVVYEKVTPKWRKRSSPSMSRRASPSAKTCCPPTCPSC